MAQNIETLRSELGQGHYANEDLLTDMGNGYVFLGDGKDAYNTYVQALEASSSDAVAYENAALLLNRVYATTTARTAFAKAASLSPQTAFFQLAYVEFMTLVYPKDPATQAAFSTAEQYLPGNTDLAKIKAAWLATMGSTTPST
jgi:hypothetical protein